MTNSAGHREIATSSIEEGLDFACNLLVAGLQDAATDPASDARVLLSALAQYLQFRYVGELGLAFEELSSLGAGLNSRLRRPEQFLDQMEWVRSSLGTLSPDKSPERTRGE